MRASQLKLFSNIPFIETERLFLRRMRPSDIDDVYEYASDVEVPKYLLWYPHPDKSFTKKYLKLIDKKYKKCEFYDWAVTYNGKMIGTCGFTSFDISNNKAEIGYVLNRFFWGKGLAAEAARAIITFGFEMLGLNRIEAHFMPDNSASRRVAEKCGMHFEGVHKEAMLAKGRYIDIEIYAINYTEYKRLRE